MAASVAPLDSYVLESKYWDGRNPMVFHTDLDCSVGRWIPEEARFVGNTHAGRRCEACAEVELDDEGEGEILSFLFAF